MRASKYEMWFDYIRQNITTKKVSVISEETGIPIGSIHKLIDRLGLREEYKKYSPRHSVNEKVEIDANFYYFVGLMLADGWVTRRNIIGINLSSKDRELIEKLVRYLQYRNKISVIPPKDSLCRGNVVKSGEKLQITFVSKIWYSLLTNYGVSENKTGYEDYNGIPEEFFYDFLCGFMDGDGNVCNSGVRLYSKSSVVLFKIEKDLLKLGITSNLMLKEPSNVLSLGKESVMRIKDKLYSNRDYLYLSRKRNKIEEFCNGER